MSRRNTKLENLSQAVNRLKEGLELYNENNELLRDGLIQRFEFTFELAWKSLKEMFENEGLIGLNSPRLVLKEAFAGELITNERLWLDMLRDRNTSSHVYSEDIAIGICKRILKKYTPALEGLKNKIAERSNQL